MAARFHLKILNSAVAIVHTVSFYWATAHASYTEGKSVACGLIKSGSFMIEVLLFRSFRGFRLLNIIRTCEHLPDIHFPKRMQESSSYSI